MMTFAKTTLVVLALLGSFAAVSGSPTSFNKRQSNPSSSVSSATPSASATSESDTSVGEASEADCNPLLVLCLPKLSTVAPEPVNDRVGNGPGSLLAGVLNNVISIPGKLPVVSGVTSGVTNGPLSAVPNTVAGIVDTIAGAVSQVKSTVGGILANTPVGSLPVAAAIDDIDLTNAAALM